MSRAGCCWRCTLHARDAAGRAPYFCGAQHAEPQRMTARLARPLCGGDAASVPACNRRGSDAGVPHLTPNPSERDGAGNGLDDRQARPAARFRREHGAPHFSCGRNRARWDTRRAPARVSRARREPTRTARSRARQFFPLLLQEAPRCRCLPPLHLREGGCDEEARCSRARCATCAAAA